MISLGDLVANYRDLVSPRVNPLFEGFWTATREHDIRIPLCSNCGNYHWYPLYLCPHCQSSNWAYASVGLEGTIFSYATIRRPLHPAFENRVGDVVALVVPNKSPGVRIVTNVIGVSASTAIDALVRAEFVAVTDDWTVPVYRVVGERREHSRVPAAL